MILTVLIATIVLSLSFFVEFALGYPPCFLCWVQRALWMGLLFLALLQILAKCKARKWIILLLFLNLSIATYHSLIQFNILEDRCKAALHVKDPADFMAALTKNPSRGCSEKSWDFLGVPAPLLNLGASLVLLSFTSSAYLFRRSGARDALLKRGTFRSCHQRDP